MALAGVHALPVAQGHRQGISLAYSIRGKGRWGVKARGPGCVLPASHTAGQFSLFRKIFYVFIP